MCSSIMTYCGGATRWSLRMWIARNKPPRHGPCSSSRVAKTWRQPARSREKRHKQAQGLTSGQKAVLLFRERDYAQSSLPHQRRIRKQLVGFDLCQRNCAPQRLARFDLYPRILGVRNVDRDNRRDAHSTLVISGFINHQTVARLHGAEVFQSYWIGDAVPNRTLVAF